MKKFRKRAALFAAAAVVLSAGCGPAENNTNNVPENNTNNIPENNTNSTNNTNNVEPGEPTGAGDENVAACTNEGVPGAPLSQDGVQCTAVANPTYDDCGARTNVSGVIDVDTTLSGCLESTGMEIEQGVTVTVDPGTSIRFTNPNASVQVYGTLVAEGTDAAPITFIGVQTSGSWGGIRLHEVSVGNSFDQVIFENGGGFDWNTSAARNAMLVVQDASTQVDVSNTVFRGSLFHAIHIADPAAVVTLDAVEFDSNAEAAIVLPPNQVGNLPDNLAFGEDEWVDVTGGEVTVSQTWPACAPLRFTDGVTVTNDALVTIQQGATLSFRADAHIIVSQGALNAVGANDAAIMFTGFQKQAGAWGGINLRAESASAENVLDHVIIEYAGGFDWNTSAVKNTSLAAVNQDVRLAVRNSVIRDSSALGFYANSELAQVSFQNVEFDGNAEAAAEIPPNHISAFDDTSIYGDGQDVIIRGGSTTVDTTATGCVPYRVIALPTIAAGTTLNLQEGAQFRFIEGAGLDIEGGLIATGTEENVVTLMGVDDEPGSWAGIRFNADAEGALDWCVLAQGGGFDWNTSASANANLNVKDPEVTLALSNTTIRDSSADGVHFNADPTLTCENVLITDDPAVTGQFDDLETACDIGTVGPS